MPHINVEPGGHDATISAYIIRREEDTWKCLVHYHRKVETLMQVGGHIERDEGAWQSLAHELLEESGYTLEELQLLQPFGGKIPRGEGNLMRPLPFVSDTHDVGDEHYHDDSCFAFIAEAEPRNGVGEGESSDLRWLTPEELQAAAKRGKALMDCYYVYEFLLEQLDHLTPVPATAYPTENPAASRLLYKRGGAHEQR